MVYVVTGGPGFGKTSTVKLLSEKGFQVCDETARRLLISSEGSNCPNGKFNLPINFETIVAEERIKFLKSIDKDSIAFSDRGLPDQIAFSWYKNKKPSSYLVQVVSENQYAKTVFLTPPWKEIFVNDEIRRETFTEATEIHNQILNSYRFWGYQPIDLPLVSPEQRMAFILNFLGI